MFDLIQNRYSPAFPIVDPFVSGIGGPVRIGGAFGVGSPVALYGIPGARLSAHEVLYRCQMMHIPPPVDVLMEAINQGYTPPNRHVCSLDWCLGTLGAKS